MQGFLVVQEKECAACGKIFEASNFNYHSCCQGGRWHAAHYCDDCIRCGAVCVHCGERVTWGDGCMISSAKSQQIRSAGDVLRRGVFSRAQSLPQNVQKAIGWYVYALIDPRDNQIFHIGKGYGNDILSHDRESISSVFGTAKRRSKKDATLRSIMGSRRLPGYYILNHKLTEGEADIVLTRYNRLFAKAPLAFSLTIIEIAKKPYPGSFMIFEDLYTQYMR